MPKTARIKSQTFEIKIGKTTFIVTEELSQNARETIDEKLLKIMSRNINDYYKEIAKNV